jgi:hypothetical protein
VGIKRGSEAQSTTFWKKGLALCSDPVARRGVGGADRKVRSVAAAGSGGGGAGSGPLLAPALCGGGTAGTEAVPAPSFAGRYARVRVARESMAVVYDLLEEGVGTLL